ncbi:prepilin-type N-terminal cleavage/methylation domain-containing protein [Candidatus Omnitrophota bacterium]
MNNGQGFTYIELLITLAIIGILFLPVMQLFSHSLYATSTSGNLITATNLARWQMERTRNLGLSKKQFQALGGQLYPPAEEEPLQMNKGFWRIARKFTAGSGPIEVEVSVYRDGYPDQPLVTLVTLIEDMSWEKKTYGR